MALARSVPLASSVPVGGTVTAVLVLRRQAHHLAAGALVAFAVVVEWRCLTFVLDLVSQVALEVRAVLGVGSLVREVNVGSAAAVRVTTCQASTCARSTVLERLLRSSPPGAP